MTYIFTQGELDEIQRILDEDVPISTYILADYNDNCCTAYARKRSRKTCIVL